MKEKYNLHQGDMITVYDNFYVISLSTDSGLSQKCFVDLKLHFIYHKWLPVTTDRVFNPQCIEIELVNF